MKQSFMQVERPAKGRSMTSCHRGIRASLHIKAGLGPNYSPRWGRFAVQIASAHVIHSLSSECP